MQYHLTYSKSRKNRCRVRTRSFSNAIIPKRGRSVNSRLARRLDGSPQQYVCFCLCSFIAVRWNKQICRIMTCCSQKCVLAKHGTLLQEREAGFGSLPDFLIIGSLNELFNSRQRRFVPDLF